ncbi:general negative regulator of transcription subunit 3 [[Candida] anglica]
MSHRKLQKEVDAIFKKINEGVDLFNYYYTRHEDSNNDSQRDKLEGDLKKEIKKLQKFRDQIKTWQSNDTIEASVVPARLQEHRRLVEEAMERYKDVEKSSKMKSYSNQSIMLAALELENELSPEAVGAVQFVERCIEELQEQSEALESEYEKLSQKKTRKNGSSEAEERKQEIDSFSSRNSFHIEKLEHVISFLKRDKIDPDLIWMIQDDINFYIESNQEPDFVDDETLYDEIFKEASKIHHREAQEKQREQSHQSQSVFTEGDESKDSSVNGSSGHNQPPPAPVPFPPQVTNSQSNSTTTSSSPNKPTISTPVLKSVTIPVSPDNSSPAIIKTLKPATTPSKPVGNLKWSAAAAGNSGVDTKSKGQLQFHSQSQSQSQSQSPKLQNSNAYEQPLTQQLAHTQSQMLQNSHSNNSQHSQKNQGIGQQGTQQEQEHKESYVPSQAQRTDTTDNSAPLQGRYETILDSMLKNSNLCPVEYELFSDMNLVKLPPGIQDLIVSFTATRKACSSGCKILVTNHQYNPYTTPIMKPFLHSALRSSFYPHLSSQEPVKKSQAVKPPLNLLKLQSYWNSIRASNNFDKFVQQIQALSLHTTTESLILVNELTMVLFYGYYYGFIPLENAIAELCLFQLGWRPYNTKSNQQSKNLDSEVGFKVTSPFEKASEESRNIFHWFKCIKVHANTQSLGSLVEFGDYYVFDLMAWDMYSKTNFKFDHSLSQNEPSKII